MIAMPPATAAPYIQKFTKNSNFKEIFTNV